MAKSTRKKVKTVKKKPVAKKASKGAPKKTIQKAPPKKTLATRKSAKKATRKEIKTTPMKKKKKEIKEEDFRTAFMKSLATKRQELQDSLDRLMHSRKEYEGELTAGDFIDEVDDAQREISAYSQFSLIERKNRELQKIDYLLTRIENEEDFGICEECAATIPRERLLIVPETTLCVACQRELEKIDQRKSMAARATSTMGPTRREVSWETHEPADEDENVLVEYHISAVPSMDIDETETPSESDDKEER